MHRVHKSMYEAQTSVPVLYIPLQHKRQKYLKLSISCIPIKNHEYVAQCDLRHTSSTC